MSKRAADKQLTQLSAAKEDESDEADDQPSGTWESASADVLAQRRIVKAHRPTSSTAPTFNPFAKTVLAPTSAAAPAAADGGGGGCAWGLSSKQQLSFAMPPIQTSKPQPPPAACASGFFGGGGGCAWSSGGGGFGAVASCAPSFSSLAAAPAAAKDSRTFASGGAVGGAFGALGQKPAEKPDADDGDDGDGGDDDPTAHEVAIASEPKLPIVATVTGEEDEACVHRVRAKVFVLESAPPPTTAAAAAPAADAADEPGSAPGSALSAGTRWVERGVGTLHLNVHKPKPHVSASAAEFVPGAPAHAAKGADGARKTRPPRLVMRVEHVGRLILNTPLLAEMPAPSRVSETSIRINSIGSALGEVASAEGNTPPPFQCLLRVKTVPEAEALMQALALAIDAHVAATLRV